VRVRKGLTKFFQASLKKPRKREIFLNLFSSPEIQLLSEALSLSLSLFFPCLYLSDAGKLVRANPCAPAAPQLPVAERATQAKSVLLSVRPTLFAFCSGFEVRLFFFLGSLPGSSPAIQASSP
jgi:hypothetical protein